MFFPKNIPEDAVMYILEYHPLIAKQIGNVTVWYKSKEEHSDCAATYFSLSAENRDWHIEWKKNYNKRYSEIEGEYCMCAKCDLRAMQHDIATGNY